MRLRLRGINAPEVHGPTRKAGLETKEFVSKELQLAKLIGVRTFKVEKYGRYVTDLYYSRTSIAPQKLFAPQYCLNNKLL